MRELDVFPLPKGTYRKSSGYGYRTNPVTGAQGTFHRGCDYAAPQGTSLLAPFDGQVTTGYEAGGAGNWIWVQNGPDLFKSFHHKSFSVRSGFVKAGTVIAEIGTTGSSTGPHAHLELWENGRNIDPTGYLDRAENKVETPAPAPVEEEEEVTVIARQSGTLAAFACNGLFKRYIASEDEYNALKYIGCKDLGINDGYLALLTEIPRTKIAGE